MRSGRGAPARPIPALERVAEAVAPAGLLCRGGFHPEPADGVPGAAATLVMIGNAGPALWQAFARAQDEGPDPMDSWTRRVVDRAARTLGARAVYPFDGPPYHPFQRWAMRCEPVHPSPIGPLIHPVFGLWHAYRAALLFAERLALPPPSPAPSPCETCADRPCLATCPVGALAPGRYDVPACLAHIAAPAGEDCMAKGCRARRACPVGREHAYAPEQARYHMARFRAAQGRAGGA